MIGSPAHIATEQLHIMNFNIIGTFLGWLTSLGTRQGWHWLKSLCLSSSPLVRRLLVPFEVPSPQGISSVGDKQGLCSSHVPAVMSDLYCQLERIESHPGLLSITRPFVARTMKT